MNPESEIESNRANHYTSIINCIYLFIHLFIGKSQAGTISHQLHNFSPNFQIYCISETKPVSNEKLSTSHLSGKNVFFFCPVLKHLKDFIRYEKAS